MKTYLFDLDGVLLDTEPRYSRFWMEAAEECGFFMSFEESLMMRSLDASLARKLLHERYGQDVYERMREARKRRMEADRAAHPVEAKPGALELISELNSRRLPYYIVTASPVERVKRYSAEARLPLPAERVISTKGVERGKPFPDVYQKAVRQAGCKAGDAIAVEDSPNGIRSAHAAGCISVMIPDMTQPTEDDMRYCDMVYKDLRDFASCVL